MVTDSGTPSRADQLRPLNEPRPVEVTIRDGLPVSLTIGRLHGTITEVQDSWIIEDEWWRQLIDRQYYVVLLEGGPARTIFHDRAADTWYAQDY